MNRCRLCNQKIAPEAESTLDTHHLERSPVDRGLCSGCWVATIELEKFLYRSKPDQQTVMGNWTEGWLREILADPKRYQ
jgi:hypothetical protein